MENTQLQRKVSQASSDISDYIDELIAEIENKESEIEDLKEELRKCHNEIADQSSAIEDLELQLKSN